MIVPLNKNVINFSLAPPLTTPVYCHLQGGVKRFLTRLKKHLTHFFFLVALRFRSKLKQDDNNNNKNNKTFIMRNFHKMFKCA